MNPIIIKHISDCAEWVFRFAESQLEKDVKNQFIQGAKDKVYQHTLSTALQNYAENVRNKYGNNSEEWDRISSCFSRCIPKTQDELFSDIRETRASRQKLLARWEDRNLIKGEKRAFQPDEKAFFNDFIRILFDVIPPPDSIRLQGVQENQEHMQIDIEKLRKSHEELTEYLKALTEQLLRQNRASAQASASANAPKEYSNKYKLDWKKPLFLNDASRNRRASQVCLCQVHIPHRYLFGEEETPSSDADYPLLDELAKNGGHLVLGDPGIGKSTLITRYLNESTDTREKRVYRLSEFSLTGAENSPGDVLLEQMGLQIEKLENTILFLDGLDECELIPEKRSVFLQNLQRDWDEWEDRFSWVVTCRRHYLSDRDSDLRQLRIPYLRLLPMDTAQIKEFLEKYEKAAKASVSEAKRAALTSEKYSGEHGSVFGVPLILYMTAAMAEIQVTEDSTLVSVYDQLFEKLFNRAYDTQKHVFLEDEQRRAIQTMDRHIALWMLFNEPEKAVIPREKYDSIYDSIYSSIKKTTDRQVEKLHLHKFHSYMHHTEGESERCYIHRTMYEYFVADGFVAEALAAKSAEELSGVIAWYWHKTKMSPTIQDYIRDKLKQPENKALCRLSDWEEAGKLMMTKGVKGCPQPSTDAVPGCPFPAYPETLAKDRVQENTAFYSLCRLLNGVRVAAGEERRIYESAASETLDALASAIRNCGADRFEVLCPNFWLQGADLRSADLTCARLTGAYLGGAHLEHAHLEHAHLTHAHLIHADLTRANLEDAYLVGAHLTRADLEHAYLDGAHLTRAHLTGADLNGAYLTGADLMGANLTLAHLTRADLNGAILYDSHLVGADLTHALLTDEQVKEIGETALASCTFSRIYVGQRKDIAKKYLSNDFFNEFFPKAAPNPPSNSK